MNLRVTTKNPLTRTHAHVEALVTCNGKNPHACTSVNENIEKVPVCARARVTVTPGDAQWRDLPSILRVPKLREHQCQCILSAFDRDRDVLNVSPTGSGKTASFVGAGLLRGGTTLVVSPLRSLMADQYRRLEELGIPVRLWNSDVSDTYKSETRRLIGAGWAGFLYTTPESLKSDVLTLALSDRVNLAVVDEAHCCLRDRGFRFNYSRVGKVLDKIRVLRRFACTATLPWQDRKELIETLHLDDPTVVISPVARSNLNIHVVERDPDTLAGILNHHSGQAGIVFAATVRTAEKLHDEFISQGRAATLYHGRLSAKQKKQVQAEFMSGEKPVIVATDAFLLGIDKADLRFVCHFDYPKSVEDWTQGFGRAGRDGHPADVYGCFRGSDEGLRSRRFLIDAAFPSISDIAAVWNYLTKAPYRDETAKHIGEQVLGYEGRYSGSGILSTLQRYGLATAQVNPEDKRRRIYRGRGDWNGMNWAPYEAEARDALNRLDQLCGLVEMDDDEIPEAIDRYFEGDGSDLARRAAV